VDKAEKTYTSGSQSIRYLSQGRNQLRQAAESAVLASDSMKPLKLEGTLDFEAEFRSQELADKFNTWSFAQKGRMVSWRSDNIIAGFDNLNKLVFFPKENLPDPENHTDAVPPVLSHQTHLLEYVLYYQ
jgi:D-aminopeptidase